MIRVRLLVTAAALLLVGQSSANLTPRVAIIIDDLGYRLDDGRRAIDLPGPIAYAILTATLGGSLLARLANERGKEVLLHLPLQPTTRDGPEEPGGIMLDMSRAAFETAFADAIDSVPFVIGVSSHRGSLLTRHPGHMGWLMAEISRRDGLFFIQMELVSGGNLRSRMSGPLSPARALEIVDDLCAALEYAQVLDCPRLHCMAGVPPDNVDPAVVESLYTENLAYAAKRLAEHGRTLLIEPINHRDMPGYLLSRQDHARGIVQRAGLDNLRIQFDVYHCQIVHGDLTRWLERQMPLVGHVQVADVPDRHEPGTGEINYRHVFATLDRLGYDGWVGCEYRPAGATEDGLHWLKNQTGTDPI